MQYVATTNTSTMVSYWDSTTQACLAVTMVVAWFIAFFGNLLVIAVVFKHEGMRTRTNLFIVNLAIADFMVSVFNMPFSLATLLAGRWFGEIMCQINGFTMLFFFCVSVHTLMYISVHKYITITHPFSERHKMTYLKVGLMIGATYVVSAVLCILTGFVLNRITYKPYTTQCGPMYPNDTKTYIHTAVISAFTYILPLLIMILSYIKIFIEIRAYSKRLSVHSNQDPDCILSRQKRATVTLVIVLCVFILSWTPYFFYANYSTALTSRNKPIPHTLNPLCYWFAYINSACNPVIYGLRVPSFREGYKRFFCRGYNKTISTEASRAKRDSLVALLRRFSRDTAAGVDSNPSVLRRLVQGIHRMSRSDTTTAGQMFGSQDRIRRSTITTPNGSSNAINKVETDDLPIVYTKNGKIVRIEQKKTTHKNALASRRRSESDALVAKKNAIIRKGENAVVTVDGEILHSYPDLTLQNYTSLEYASKRDSSEGNLYLAPLLENGISHSATNGHAVPPVNSSSCDENEVSNVEKKVPKSKARIKCHRSISENTYDHPKLKPTIAGGLHGRHETNSERITRWWRSSAHDLAFIQRDVATDSLQRVPSIEHLDTPTTPSPRIVKSRSDSCITADVSTRSAPSNGATAHKSAWSVQMWSCILRDLRESNV